MSSKLSFIFDRPIIGKTAKLLTNCTTALGLHLVLKSRCIMWLVDWKYEPWHDPKCDVVRWLVWFGLWYL